MQLLAEKEVLMAVASLVVHCCASCCACCSLLCKNVIVASLLYDVADVQFTVEQCFSNRVPQNLRVPGVLVARGSAETDRRCLERN